ncbi:hypothetical protein AB0C90_32325 [Streptomyces sp. NPDC048550]|uniref:hypothetical protein n=1 Tax=unclassified Streptomyces TaxID=2593676 RepID=UPI0022574670|nr:MULTISPECIES: hypothetical protein [unclassified Streptomyces]MCX5145213.1 hypothetical protein [Streptomyces sp. NBC_00320]WSN48534.1 hypothetical protein OG299_12955 [Streptomyces sp. NBC_01296]WSW62053.1 hypothetical protein OG513_27660 [Streptomyces sp. NBC_00998]
MDAATRSRVGLLCDQLSRWPSLREIIREGGAGPELDDLLALLAGPAEPAPRRMAELVDAVERSCARQGLAGWTSREGVPLPGVPTLPPGMTGTAGVAGWTCPFSRCDRVVTPDESPRPPECAAAHGRDARMKPYRPVTS